MISLQELNASSPSDFVAALASIFEHSPWVPERVLQQRPFTSRLHLHTAMCSAVEQANQDEQLALIRAHPELAGRAAVRGALTPESSREQQGAGLSACSPEEFARLQELNAAYSTKFGFPFVLAVKGHDRASVIASLAERITNDGAHERSVALHEIGRIAGFRLADLISEPLGQTIMAMCDALARHSEQPDGLTCSYLSDAHRATAADIRDWMLAAGLSVEVDAISNVVGRRPGAHSALTLMTGSHYDTVINGGKYDGRLGIVLPIAVAAQLRREGVTLPYALEIVAFADEEGVRFKSTFLGSGAITGRFDADVLESTDSQGISMRDAMRSANLDPAAIPRMARDPAQLAGFIEVHIEQGPVLLGEILPLGVVTSIAGSIRSLLTITGLAGHAGTVPMHMRQDAAVAAAEIILAVERICSQRPGVVGTVGRLAVPNGAINVIPGRCELSIDLRAATNDVRDAAYAEVMSECERIASRRRVGLETRKVLEVDCVPCAPAMQARWASSIARVTGIPEPRRLPSGAGHDAMMMATITDIGMLFVRCGNGGISHHPAESLSEEDADLAARTFADFLMNFATSP